MDAASHLGGSAHLTRIEDFQDVMRTVLYAHERWDGAGGFPGLAAGKDIPIESRVLSVADAWAALTCRGSRELDPLAALCLVRARAGGEFDPEVVAAAIRSVEQELLPITVFQRTAAARRLAPVPG